MKTWALRIRAEDRDVFSQIKSGKKKIETRALGGRFNHVAKGDNLFFICGKGRLKKKVKKVQKFKSIKAMLGKISYKKVWPHLANPSLKEVEKIYYNYSGYRERIKKYGLVAFWI
ncbi:MAG: hypothetical protein Q8Q97_03000 [bacterium]|nr:hypothetical protein [bacterium]